MDILITGEKSYAVEQNLSFFQGFVKLEKLFSTGIIVAVYCQNRDSNCVAIR